jgi:hypothetical protein
MRRWLKLIQTAFGDRLNRSLWSLLGGKRGVQRHAFGNLIWNWETLRLRPLLVFLGPRRLRKEDLMRVMPKRDFSNDHSERIVIYNQIRTF